MSAPILGPPSPRKPVPAAYRLYVDDSGEKEYGSNTSRYFVYAGVVVAAADEARLNAEVADIKRRYLGREEVEIKSNWLRHPRERRRRYLDPLGISTQALDLFASEVQEWMASMSGRFVGVAIDKPQMINKYGGNARYPSGLAYQFLLQRLELQMRGIKTVERPVIGHVTMDNMDGASPKLNQWRDLLRAQHGRLLKDGCDLTKLRFENCAEMLRFGDSSRFHLLQIADLLAYDVFRHFRDHGDAWDSAPANTQVPVYGRLRPLLKGFLVGPNNQWEGYGIVKWPRVRSGRVVLTPEELV